MPADDPAPTPTPTPAPSAPARPAAPMTLVIMIPSPGLVATPFFNSVIGLTQDLRGRGIRFATKTYEFSDIMMSRNYLMSYFLSQKMFSHALLLDCDLEFGRSQFFRLMDFNRDFVVAPYARRQMGIRALQSALEDNLALPQAERLPPEDVFARSVGHVVQRGSSSPGWKRRREGDFVTIAGGGMGFTLISRRVPEAMVAAGVVDAYPAQGRFPIFADAPEFHNFFGHKISPDGTFIMGEDQSFFHRWIFGCGGEVWADTKARLVHHGTFGFRGNFAVDRANDEDPA
jgi:hypothetical protein